MTSSTQIEALRLSGVHFTDQRRSQPKMTGEEITVFVTGTYSENSSEGWGDEGQEKLIA